MDDKDKGNEPAFPSQVWIADDDTNQPVPDGWSNGMSLRDYFAGQVVAGFSTATAAHGQTPSYAQVAKFAYGIADAMLAERRKGK